MKVRYTRRAFRQLSAILDYVEARSPQGAENVKRRIQAVMDLVAEHPHIGRATNRIGFRRVVAYPYPYLIVYRATKSEIVIHGIRHGARRPLGGSMPPLQSRSPLT